MPNKNRMYGYSNKLVWRVLLFLFLSTSLARAQVYLYVVDDNADDGPQLTRLDITASSPSLEIVANTITYAGPPGFPQKNLGDRLGETEAAALDPRTDTAYIISNENPNNAALLVLNLSNGEAIGIGFTGAPDINGLAFDPYSGKLYGVSSRLSQLYQIDTNTGVATPLPGYVLQDSHGNPKGNIEGLAFDHFQRPPVLYGIDEDTGKLYLIDIASGVGTEAGTANFLGEPALGFEALEFSHDGTLFAANTKGKIYTIDRSNNFLVTEFGDDLIIDGEGLILWDGLIPVELMSFNVSRSGDSVTIRWTTASETENLGFQVYRRDERQSTYSSIVPDLIRGAGTSASAHSYAFVDKDIVAGLTYFYKLADIDFDGHLTFHGPLSITIDPAPVTNTLAQNYPNPFNPTTTIRFSIQQSGFTRLAIYGTTGQMVRSLVAGELAAGNYSYLWDGADNHGVRVASGVYFYRLQTKGVEIQRKLVLTK